VDSACTSVQGVGAALMDANSLVDITAVCRLGNGVCVWPGLRTGLRTAARLQGVGHVKSDWGTLFPTPTPPPPRARTAGLLLHPFRCRRPIGSTTPAADLGWGTASELTPTCGSPPAW
jgi:hypothetical protein